MNSSTGTFLVEKYSFFSFFYFFSFLSFFRLRDLSFSFFSL